MHPSCSIFFFHISVIHDLVFMKNDFDFFVIINERIFLYE